MVQCESCLVWQHVQCMGLAGKDVSSMTYYCEQCRPDLHAALAVGNGRFAPAVAIGYAPSKT